MDRRATEAAEAEELLRDIFDMLNRAGPVLKGPILRIIGDYLAQRTEAAQIVQVLPLPPQPGTITTTSAAHPQHRCSSCGSFLDADELIADGGHARYQDDGKGNAVPILCGPVYKVAESAAPDSGGMPEEPNFNQEIGQ